MLIYEYKLAGSKAQYQAIDGTIRIVQFVRNKALRLWMDVRGTSKNDLQCYCAVLARGFPFAARLNFQARQAAADRAWFAISRFWTDRLYSLWQGQNGQAGWLKEEPPLIYGGECQFESPVYDRKLLK